jgi:hypothetical protein
MVAAYRIKPRNAASSRGFQWEYYFSDDYLKDALEFGIDDLLALQLD